MSRNHDVDDLIEQARTLGAIVRRTAKGHWKIVVPGGGIVVCPGSPSCSRSVRDTRAQLRRAGMTSA